MRDRDVAAGLAFALEDLRAWDDAISLIGSNHAETGALPDADFRPDRARYQALEQAGVTRVFTARGEASRVLVGYALFIVSPHPHYPGVVFAMQDVVYVAPAHRGAGAIAFMRFQDDVLREQGAQVVYRHVTVRRDYSRALLAMGYRPEETRFIRDFRGERTYDLDDVLKAVPAPAPAPQHDDCPALAHNEPCDCEVPGREEVA